MDSIHLYIAVSLPTLAIITSLIVSLVQISGIRIETQIQIAGIRDEAKGIHEDIREIRSDIKLLTGKVYEMMGDKH